MNVYTLRFRFHQYNQSFDGRVLRIADDASAAEAAFADWFEQTHNRYISFADGGKRATYDSLVVSEATASEFYDRVAAHDWYHEMSDDGAVHRAGVRDMVEIRAMADLKGEAWQTILQDWTKHHYTGKPWGTELAPPPIRPKGT